MRSKTALRSRASSDRIQKLEGELKKGTKEYVSVVVTLKVQQISNTE